MSPLQSCVTDPDLHHRIREIDRPSRHPLRSAMSTLELLSWVLDLCYDLCFPHHKHCLRSLALIQSCNHCHRYPLRSRTSTLTRHVLPNICTCIYGVQNPSSLSMSSSVLTTSCKTCYLPTAVTAIGSILIHIIIASTSSRPSLQPLLPVSANAPAAYTSALGLPPPLDLGCMDRICRCCGVLHWADK